MENVQTSTFEYRMVCRFHWVATLFCLRYQLRCTILRIQFAKLCFYFFFVSLTPKHFDDFLTLGLVVLFILARVDAIYFKYCSTISRHAWAHRCKCVYFPFFCFPKKHGKPKQSRGSPATECNNLPIRRSEKANREKGRESEQERKTLVKNQNKNNKQFQSDYVALFHCIGIW